MDYPTKNRKRAQRRYRDRQAQVKKLRKIKYRKKNVELPELPTLDSLGDQGQLEGGSPGDMLRRDEDERERHMWETFGDASNEPKGPQGPRGTS